ncbi:GGDEF domain-containing protein [Paenalcaligenes sp. Me131]|uniref:GGDEF domain-containing protein n=1 Tax=Paenalcaligenes sp. Me131 TaxID=3392636 RepID=UPI003D2C9D3E
MVDSSSFLTPPVPSTTNGIAAQQELGQWVLASNTAVAIFNADDQLYFASPSFMQLYAVQPGDQTFHSIISHCFHQQKGPRIIGPLSQWISTVQSKRRTIPVRTFEVVMLDGRWMWGTEVTFTNQWTMVQIIDFTAIKNKEFALQKAHAEAVLAAKTDDLTGLPNRGAIIQRFHQLYEYCLGQHQSLTVAIIDLDHFKSVNDNFGHAMGDAVLRHFSTQADILIRAAGGVIGRSGGEEFLVVLPNSPTSCGQDLLEKLRVHLQKHPFSTAQSIIYYTFSSGLVSSTQLCSFEDLYKAADKALYTAKIRGRNQDCVSTPVKANTQQ